MSNDPDHKQAEAVRMAALVIFVSGVFWVAATWAGAQFGWSQRVRALFELIALTGFAFALIRMFRIWRARQRDDE